MSPQSSQPFVIFGAPDIREEEIAEVEATLRSRWIGTGPRVAAFEKEFAEYRKVSDRRVAAVNSCTAGLHVSMLAAALGPGDEVLTTAMTFCATVNAIIHAGATPVPVDIDPVSLNIDIDQLAGRLTERTRAIVPVHFAGRPCNMDALMSLAREHDLAVIEDCAHAIESEWKGRPVGTFGDFGCFSFYVTKNITTGEGGMVIARAEKDIERIKILSLHGMTKDAWHRFGDQGYKHYQVVEAGFKYNMMDIQAALGSCQLRRVESSWKRREQIWKHYQESLTDLPVGLPTEPDSETRHGYHLYTISIEESECGIDRDTFIDRITARGIGVGVHYLCLASHPYYRERFGWRPGSYPVADRYGASTVSVPLSAALTDVEVERVVGAIKDVVAKRSL